MKTKLFTLFLLVGASACLWAKQPVGHLNPYAYEVSTVEKVNQVTVQYTLNAAADSTHLVVYCNGNEVGHQVVSDNAKGFHRDSIDLSAYTQTGTYSLGIRVFGTPYPEPFQLKEVDDNGDTTAVHYAFFHPKGVDVDKNPASPYFGRILTDEAMEDTPDDGYHSSVGKDGIYAFDASFAPILNGNDWAFRGGYDFAVRMADGKTRVYAPYRIRISEDGRIFASMQDDRYSSLYELSPDLQTWTPIFSGTMVGGELRDANGNYISGINCGLDVTGSGENLKIFMLNLSLNGFSSYNLNDFTLATYHLGTAKTWTGPATTAVPLSDYLGSNAVGVAASSGIAIDDHGGFWYHAARSVMIEQRGLCHVNAAGQVDFEFHATPADTLKYKIPLNGSNGGAGCRLIKDNGEDYLYVGMARLTAQYPGCGHMQVFKVIYNANGGVADLQLTYDKHFIGISTNLNDIALDYGHNLYVVGNSNEKILPVAMPYSGVTETPHSLSFTGAQVVEDPTSGTCGPDLTWEVVGHKLLIHGEGAMTNYASVKQRPWNNVAPQIKKVVLDESVTSIGDFAFANCSSLPDIHLPAGLTRIGDYAFMNDSCLPTVSIPNSVTRIGTGAFQSCAWMQTVAFPDALQTIPGRLFVGCENLIFVCLPESLIHVEYDAFANCPNLRALTCYALNPPVVINSDPTTFNKQIRLYVPEEALTAYQNNDEWGKLDVRAIGDTDIPSLDADDRPAFIKILLNGQLYILAPDGTRYDATGKRVE